MKESFLAAALLNAVMALLALGMFAVPVMAPSIAAEMALDAALVTSYAALLWAASIGTSIASGYLIARLGPIGVAQLCLVLAALGLGLAASGALATFALGAILIGLAHGAETPASSYLLAKITPLRQQPFVFSFKQTGVQIGGAASGFLFPALLLWVGWRGALLALVVVLALAAFALNQPRRYYNRTYFSAAAASRSTIGRALATVWRDPALRRLTLSSFAFVATQVCFNTFLVSYLVKEGGLSLPQAGSVLAAGQVGGLIGRLAWGAISGRLIKAPLLLAWVGIGMMAGVALLGSALHALSPSMLALLCFFLGLTASGWNGVYLAELARLAPREEVGRITGASFLIGSSGLILGPLVFGLIAARASFGHAYIAMAVFAFTGVVLLLWPQRLGRVREAR